jgi:hypothetical protein
MPKITATYAARKLAAQRRHHRGGRPKKPTACPKCGQECPGFEEARRHCRKPRAKTD